MYSGHFFKTISLGSNEHSGACGIKATLRDAAAKAQPLSVWGLWSQACLTRQDKSTTCLGPVVSRLIDETGRK